MDFFLKGREFTRWLQFICLKLNKGNTCKPQISKFKKMAFILKKTEMETTAMCAHCFDATLVFSLKNWIAG